MKGIIIIPLILLIGLAFAYTPEQQATLTGLELSFQLGAAYEKAVQGQNVTEYNALVDQYNAWIKQNFGDDASLVKAKMIEQAAANNPQAAYGKAIAESAALATTPLASGQTITATQKFNTSSGLSGFGKESHYVATGVSNVQTEDTLSTIEANRFVNS